jgi:hypothetical protein
MFSPLVIVNNFYIIGVSVPPAETDTPLIVYPNAVLPLPTAGQGLKSVPRWNPEVFYG